MQKYLPCPSFLAYDIQSAVMEKVEALDLLEESWFFENLFDRRRRMLRCYSDPCTSPNFSHDVLAKDSCDQTGNGLVRAPSFPPCIGKEEKVRESKDNGGKIKLNTQLSVQISEMTCSDSKIHEIRSTDELSQRNLVRTPSLPSPRRTNELTQDNDSDLRMSKLIRQAMAHSPDILPPRHSHNKALAMNLQRSSRPPRNQEVEAINNTNEASVTRGRHSNPKPMLRKSPNDLAFQELQGFKDLGFTFDDEDLSPDVVNILPGLKGTKIDELEQGKVRRKPYLSEAWLVQGPTPPLPACVTKTQQRI